MSGLMTHLTDRRQFCLVEILRLVDEEADTGPVLRRRIGQVQAKIRQVRLQGPGVGSPSIGVDLDADAMPPLGSARKENDLKVARARCTRSPSLQEPVASRSARLSAWATCWRNGYTSSGPSTMTLGCCGMVRCSHRAGGLFRGPEPFPYQ
jgi:hypothetical protein